MRTIWKYEIPLTDHFSLPLPAGAQVLTIQAQRGAPMLWALVDPEAPPAPRHFRMAGTGHRLPDEPGTYRGTFQLADGDLIFHVFETAR